MHITKDHDDRLAEFLDTAQRLFLEKGYEDTTITAIIEAIGVSKGAFYHYFRSKEELLDAMADRAATAAMAVVGPIAADSSRGAADRLNAVFAAATSFKARERALTLTFLRVLYNDKNLRLRKRIEDRNRRMIAPAIAGVLREGVAAGELEMESPEDTALLLLDISVSMTERLALDAIAAASATGAEARNAFVRVRRYLRSYEEAAARIIGAKPGSVRMVDADVAAILMGDKA